MVRRTTWIAALMDFPLAAVVTSRLARAAFGLTFAALALLGLFVVIYAALQSFVIGVLALMATAAGLLAGAVLVRLWLGAVVALSRLEERTEEIAEQLAGIALNTARGPETERRARVGSPGGGGEEP